MNKNSPYEIRKLHRRICALYMLYPSVIEFPETRMRFVMDDGTRFAASFVPMAALSRLSCR